MRIQPAFELSPAQRNDPAKVEDVARKLEGQFAQMLVKSMRDASFGDSLFPGENTMFRDMYDQKIAEAMTRGKGLGLSAVIARQLSGTGAEGPALDTQVAPAKASRAYQLNAPATPPPALPMDGAEASLRMLQRMGGDPADPLQAPIDPSHAQALDMIAGRDSSSFHQAIGSQAPYASPLPSADNWAGTDDRWPATASNAGSGGSRIDPLTTRSAVAQLGAHTPEGFVASIWGHAQAAADELGVDARALVAQAALETGWGKRQINHGDGRSAHNLFGIKANGWNGERATVGTHEYVDGVRRQETASFRSYASPAESFADYVRLLKNNPRYQRALQAGTDVRGFARGLQQAGYATDPSYAAKISAIAGGPTIERAVSALTETGARLGRTFASTAQAALGTLRR